MNIAGKILSPARDGLDHGVQVLLVNHGGVPSRRRSAARTLGAGHRVAASLPSVRIATYGASLGRVAARPQPPGVTVFTSSMATVTTSTAMAVACGRQHGRRPVAPASVVQFEAWAARRERSVRRMGDTGPISAAANRNSTRRPGRSRRSGTRRGEDRSAGAPETAGRKACGPTGLGCFRPQAPLAAVGGGRRLDQYLIDDAREEESFVTTWTLRWIRSIGNIDTAPPSAPTAAPICQRCHSTPARSQKATEHRQEQLRSWPPATEFGPAMRRICFCAPMGSPAFCSSGCQGGKDYPQLLVGPAPAPTGVVVEHGLDGPHRICGMVGARADRHHRRPSLLSHLEPDAIGLPSLAETAWLRPAR